jgi:hypothetical protein
MSLPPLSSNQNDPLAVLGLPRHASETDVRARYLELVREHPPERDPSRFQQIHAAYQAASDPLILAGKLLTPDRDEPRAWDLILNEQRDRPPRLSVESLLGLGNRPSNSQPNLPPKSVSQSPLSVSSVTPDE